MRLVLRYGVRDGTIKRHIRWILLKLIKRDIRFNECKRKFDEIFFKIVSRFKF